MLKLSETTRPIVLLPGFASHISVLRPLERRLQRLGRRTLCPSLPLGIGSIPRLAERLQLAVADAGLEEVDVIAHSMGGLVASYWLKRLDEGRCVRRVIALGTPFNGVAAARLAALLLGPLGSVLREMTPGAPLLRLLARLPVPGGCALVSVSGSRDWVVPVASTWLPATPGHIQLDAGPLDHFDLLLKKRGFECLGSLLETEPPVSPQIRSAA